MLLISYNQLKAFALKKEIMRQLAVLTIFISALFVTLVSSNSDELVEITPESHHPKLFREIYTQLARTHYSSQDVNDEFSQLYLNYYLGNNSYLS